MRRSELIGLMWDDIDMTNKTIHIQRAVTQTTGKIVIGETKSETSNRYIPISDSLISVINLIPRESEYVISGEKPDNLLYRILTLISSNVLWKKQVKNLIYQSLHLMSLGIPMELFSVKKVLIFIQFKRSWVTLIFLSQLVLMCTTTLKYSENS